MNARLFVDLLGSGADRNGVDRRVSRLVAVAASWSDAGYLDPLGVTVRDAGSKRYVAEDGHGADAALTLIHDTIRGAVLPRLGRPRGLLHRPRSGGTAGA